MVANFVQFFVLIIYIIYWKINQCISRRCNRSCAFFGLETPATEALRIRSKFFYFRSISYWKAV